MWMTHESRLSCALIVIDISESLNENTEQKTENKKSCTDENRKRIRI